MSKEKIRIELSNLTDEEIGYEYLKVNQYISSAEQKDKLKVMLETADRKSVILDLFKERKINLPDLLKRLSDTESSITIKDIKNKILLRMFLGAIISIIGVILTVSSKGNVLFYGAIFGGFFIFIGGVYGLYQIRNEK